MYPFELSGGMARRVLIATAAMERPRLVVADEPTPGLDARSAKRMLGHFRELAEAGAAVLFITHDLELALTVADQIVVLYAGETIEQTTPDRLRHPYTRALWQALPQNGFHTLPGTQPYPERSRRDASLRPGVPSAARIAASVRIFRTDRPIPGTSAACMMGRTRHDPASKPD